MESTAPHNHQATEYCEKHPDVETSLRCNRCGRLMCSKCAVRTPTGYRCDDCVRGQQRIFDTATLQDYVLGAGVAGILGFVGGLIIPSLGFFALILAYFAGIVIAEAVRRVVSRRRSKRLFQVVTAAVIVGGLLPAVGPIILASLAFGAAGMGQFLAQLSFGLVWPLIYAILAASSTYYRLSGIRL